MTSHFQRKAPKRLVLDQPDRRLLNGASLRQALNNLEIDLVIMRPSDHPRRHGHAQESSAQPGDDLRRRPKAILIPSKEAVGDAAQDASSHSRIFDKPPTSSLSPFKPKAASGRLSRGGSPTTYRSTGGQIALRSIPPPVPVRNTERPAHLVPQPLTPRATSTRHDDTTKRQVSPSAAATTDRYPSSNHEPSRQQTQAQAVAQWPSRKDHVATQPMLLDESSAEPWSLSSVEHRTSQSHLLSPSVAGEDPKATAGVNTHQSSDMGRTRSTLKQNIPRPSVQRSSPIGNPPPFPLPPVPTTPTKASCQPDPSSMEKILTPQAAHSRATPLSVRISPSRPLMITSPARHPHKAVVVGNAFSEAIAAASSLAQRIVDTELSIRPSRPAPIQISIEREKRRAANDGLANTIELTEPRRVAENEQICDGIKKQARAGLPLRVLGLYLDTLGSISRMEANIRLTRIVQPSALASLYHGAGATPPCASSAATPVAVHRTYCASRARPGQGVLVQKSPSLKVVTEGNWRSSVWRANRRQPLSKNALAHLYPKYEKMARPSLMTFEQAIKNEQQLLSSQRPITRDSPQQSPSPERRTNEQSPKAALLRIGQGMLRSLRRQPHDTTRPLYPLPSQSNETGSLVQLTRSTGRVADVPSRTKEPHLAESRTESNDLFYASSKGRPPSSDVDPRSRDPKSKGGSVPSNNNKNKRRNDVSISPRRSLSERVGKLSGRISNWSDLDGGEAIKTFSMPALNEESKRQTRGRLSSLNVYCDKSQTQRVILVIDKIGIRAGTSGCLLGQMLAPRAGPIVAESQRDYDSILIRSLIFLVPGLDLLLLLAHQSRKACELKDNQDVQRRILGVMRVWMDNKHAEAAAWDDDLFDSIMLNGMNAGESLVGLCHRLQLDRRSAQTNQAHELRRTQTASRGITMTKQLRSASSLLNIHALDPMNILTLNEKILAQYLAAVDLVLFRAATDSDQVEHWIQHSRSDAALEHHRCPVQQTQLFEERAAVIKHWVQVVILVSRTPGSRANAYKMFVRVVKLLISYGDLEGASVTLGALVSDRLSRSSFPITWHALEAEGLTGQLRNVQYMLNDKYEATLSSLADPVIPLFTGHRGLLHKVARQFGRPDIFDLKALATNSEELTTRVPASQALGYKYEVSVHGVGPLLDLSKYIRMWGDIDAARVRVRAGHAFGTVGQAAFVSQLYGLEMNKRNDVDEVNHDLEVVSEMIESSMLRSFTLTMNNTNPDDAQRQAVLEALCKSAMTDEAGWI